MSNKTVSVQIDRLNLTWLEARSEGRSLSEILNEILGKLRSQSVGRARAADAEAVRSVRGTIRLPSSDTELLKAKQATHRLFRQSAERKGSQIGGPGA